MKPIGALSGTLTTGARINVEKPSEHAFLAGMVGGICVVSV